MKNRLEEITLTSKKLLWYKGKNVFKLPLNSYRLKFQNKRRKTQQNISLYLKIVVLIIASTLFKNNLNIITFWGSSSRDCRRWSSSGYRTFALHKQDRDATRTNAEKATRKLSKMVTLAPKCCSTTVTESLRETLLTLWPWFPVNRGGSVCRMDRGQQSGHFRNSKKVCYYVRTSGKCLNLCKNRERRQISGWTPEIEKAPSVGVQDLQWVKKLKDILLGKTPLMLEDKLLWEHKSVMISHFINIRAQRVSFRILQLGTKVCWCRM